ncbi:hypothetical protein ADUPG1_011847 [Aduncisulcus paluster]|uniref:Uncharacterized protein n=1 Tax=Aduncisulcus paluster TaxID=2918883 RepID=A0ABQ5JXI1_9EUKA|nr:hypothetical protein ADUPG1_011847 [Aduncisulcus paluster]
MKPFDHCVSSLYLLTDRFGLHNSATSLKQSVPFNMYSKEFQSFSIDKFFTRELYVQLKDTYNRIIREESMSVQSTASSTISHPPSGVAISKHEPKTKESYIIEEKASETTSKPDISHPTEFDRELPNTLSSSKILQMMMENEEEEEEEDWHPTDESSENEEEEEEEGSGKTEESEEDETSHETSETTSKPDISHPTEFDRELPNTLSSSKILQMMMENEEEEEEEDWHPTDESRENEEEEEEEGSGKTEESEEDETSHESQDLLKDNGKRRFSEKE